MCDNDDKPPDDETEAQSNAKKNQHDTEVRKRIEDLLEKKHLKALLDDADEWDMP